MNASEHNEKFNDQYLPDGIIPCRLTNDYMFRAVLQSSEVALKGFISALLHIPLGEMISVVIAPHPAG